MTFLPIVGRELRVASRRPATYWIRAGSAGACLLVGLWSFVMSRHSDPAEVGMAFFGLLSGMAGLYCLFSGVRWTSDCLSQEKREGTLGLLFLTDLRGYDVVLGKLAANSVGAVYGVLAVVPILALPLLLGGVTLGDVGRMAMVALNTMFLSLALGIAVSACVRNARKAAAAVLLLVLTLTALLPALGAWLASEQVVRALHPLFFYPSPGFAYFWAYDMNYRRGVPMFWSSMATIHLLGWVALVLACWVAPRSWQDRPAGSFKLAWRARWRRLWSGSAARSARYREALLDQNPVFWLLARSPAKATSVWLALGVGLAAWLWGLYKEGEDWLTEPIYLLAGLVLNILMKGWVAAETGRRFAEDRQAGALELLLCTPLELKDLFRGQWLALRRQFLGPLVCVLALFLLFLFLTLQESYAHSDSRDFWLVFWVGAGFMLVADLYAIYWVGMWQGITSRNPNRVAAETSSRILVLPWLGMAVFLLLAALSNMSGGGVHLTPTGFFMLWLVLGLLVDLILGFLAFDKLHSRFREMAAQKYLPQPSIWTRWFRGG